MTFLGKSAKIHSWVNFYIKASIARAKQDKNKYSLLRTQEDMLILRKRMGFLFGGMP